MYTYSIESDLIIWEVTNQWQAAIDNWSSTRLSLTCDDVAIHVLRDGKLITVLENREDIKNHSDFLMAVQDASNRIEGRIMMDMYEQEVNGMNVVETKDDFLDRSYGDEQKSGTHDKDRFLEKQESYNEFIMRSIRDETNYTLADDMADYEASVAASMVTIEDAFQDAVNRMEGSDLTVDFHGDFETMDEATQDAIINPKHYKMIPKEAYADNPEGLEYMDLMEYMLAHHEGVESHLLGQVFKYACRLGKKDAKLQDAKKIAWYANRLVTVIEKGQ
jgi:hypothetical protein